MVHWITSSSKPVEEKPLPHNRHQDRITFWWCHWLSLSLHVGSLFIIISPQPQDCEAPWFAVPAMNSKRAFSLQPCLSPRWGQLSKSCGDDTKSITARLMRKQKRTEGPRRSPETRLTRELRRPLPSALQCRVQICKDKFLIAMSAFCSARERFFCWS